VESATTVHCLSLKNVQKTLQPSDFSLLTIMIDDDESAIAAILRASTLHSNATVVCFTSSDEALSYVESESVLLIALR